MRMKFFIDVSAAPHGASIRYTGQRATFYSFEPFGQSRNQAVGRRQGRQANLVLMKATPSPPGGPIPPAKSMSHAAPRPKACTACLREVKMVPKAGTILQCPGITQFGKLTLGDGSMALPHVSVPNISYVDWAALKRAGFEGAVFDKDNTLTEPYAIAIAPVLVDSLRKCIQTFDGKVVLLSNSAGLEEFDPEGEEAEKLEKLLGVAVLRHKYKKPQGGADELEKYFGCSADKLIMVGDRYLTDIVYGNRNGLLTIRPAPLTMKGDPSVVRMARGIEEKFVALRKKRGTKAPAHPLITSPEMLKEFVKEPEPVML